MANAVFNLANITHEVDGPESAKPLYREYEQLMRELSETLNTPVSKKDLANATFLRLQNEIQASNNRELPFSFEILDKEVSNLYLPELLKIEKVTEDLNKERYLDHLQACRLSRINNQLSRHYFSIADYKNLQTKLNQTISILMKDSKFISQFKVEHLFIAYLFRAISAQKSSQDQLAGDSFILAENMLSEMKVEYWDKGYFEALFCWYFSNFAVSIGDIQKADEIYMRGLEAIRHFCVFNARNGKEILKSFLIQELPSKKSKV